jgi:dehydrogenase/reductase SDR family protein 7B
MSGEPKSYRDRVVWITGASSGIGAALAQAFAQRDATLVLSARRRDRLEAVRARCDHAERHWVAPLDLTDSATIPGVAEMVLARFGRVDILVNNGGLTQRSLAKDTRLEVDRRLMETNYFGTVALTKAVLPSMLARRRGDIVVISSLIGHFSTPLRSAYAASKHALHGFFDALRAEVHADGLHVMLVCPGFVRTEISLHALTADGSPQGSMDSGQATGMSPEDCAARILTGLDRRREEIVVGGRETRYLLLHRFFPGLLRRALRSSKVT